MTSSQCPCPSHVLLAKKPICESRLHVQSPLFLKKKRNYFLLVNLHRDYRNFLGGSVGSCHSCLIPYDPVTFAWMNWLLTRSTVLPWWILNRSKYRLGTWGNSCPNFRDFELINQQTLKATTPLYSGGVYWIIIRNVDHKEARFQRNPSSQFTTSLAQFLCRKKSLENLKMPFLYKKSNFSFLKWIKGKERKESRSSKLPDTKLLFP